MYLQAIIAHKARMARGVDFNVFNRAEVDVLVELIKTCLACIESVAADQLPVARLRESIVAAHARASAKYAEAQYLAIRLRETWDDR